MSRFLSKTVGRYTGRVPMSAGQGLFKTVVGDIPEMKFDVIIPPDTKKTLLLFGATIGGGIMLNGFFNYLSK